MNHELDGAMIDLGAAISGGMVFPPMTGAVVDARDAHTAMAIPMMGYILALMWVLFFFLLGNILWCAADNNA